MNRFWSWGLPAMIAPGLFAAPAGGAAADHASAEGAADEDGDDDADVPSATHRKA